VKATAITQLPPVPLAFAAGSDRLAVHVVPGARVKSLAFTPVIASGVPDRTSAAWPVLVKVTVSAPLVVPTFSGVLNVKEVALNVAVGTTPVPDKVTACGDPVALSVIVSVPLRVPVAVGVKVTEIVQFLPPATLAPQVLVSAKSPEATIDVTVNAACPELASETVSAVLVVPTLWELKVRLVADSVAVAG